MSFTAKAAKSAKDENELSRSILDAAFRVHSAIDQGYWRAHMKRVLLTNCAPKDSAC